MPQRRTLNLFTAFTLDSAYVTEVRRLLQTLDRQGRDKDRRTYLITSAGRGDGKSTICALLAIVAAKVFRKRTLVIDADIRRPTLHHLLGIASRPGLCELLRGTVSPDATTAAGKERPSHPDAKARQFCRAGNVTGGVR